jgi:NitT/TauT family transport system substrate-binding protein
MHQLRVSATSHGQNYLPQYHAAATGGYQQRGLSVEIWDRDPWTDVLTDLTSGAADLVLGGLWVPAMYAERGLDLVALGQVNARFSKALLTREPVEDFAWSWIEGRTVLAPGAGGTAPYEFTAGLIRAAGVSPSDARFVRDLSTPMLLELFAGGLGDAIILDELTATRVALAGGGHVTYRMAGPGGVMPNSVYYTTRDRIEGLLEPTTLFLEAVQDAMDDINAGADVAPLLAEQWPAIPLEALTAATRELSANGTWDTVRIDADACDRWIAILRDGGLVNSEVSFGSLVDTRAVDAMSAAPPIVGASA